MNIGNRKSKKKRENTHSKDLNIYYVALGARQDCNELLERFSDLDTVRFREFCTIWKQLNFSLIFVGRNLISESREFTEEIFHIAKRFLVDEKNQFNFRIGALYLLYGLYMRQPVRRSVQIRMTLSDYESFINIMGQLKLYAHLDGTMVGYLLAYKYQAFHLVFTPYNYGLHRSFRKYHDNSLKAYFIDRNVISRQLDTINVRNEFTKALEKLNEEYYKAKCVLPEASGGEPEEALRLVDKNFASKFQNAYDDLQIEYQKSGNTRSTNKNEDLENSDLDEEKHEFSIKERREEIKRKAFSADVVTKTSSVDIKFSQSILENKSDN